jgi:hypothetical protein
MRGEARDERGPSTGLKRRLVEVHRVWSVYVGWGWTEHGLKTPTGGGAQGV